MNQAEISVIFGQRGSGKTTRAVTLTRRFPRVLYYDTLGHDYRDGVACYCLAELKAFWRSCYQDRFRIVYKPERPEEDFATVCSLVSTCGDLAFVVEEVDLYFRAGNCCPEFKHIISRGRHDKVDLIAVTQAPKGFGLHLRSQASRWNIFSTREPDHVEYFRHRCSGIDPADLAVLAKYEYIAYEDGEDSYWICRDDLRTGGTEKREREYLYDRPWNGRTVPDCRNVGTGPKVALQSEDRPTGVPAASNQSPPADGQSPGQ
jgi:hypothetical protein